MCHISICVYKETVDIQIHRVSIFASRNKLWGNNDMGLWDSAGSQNMLATRAETPFKFIRDQAFLVSPLGGSGLLSFLAKVIHTFLIMTFLAPMRSLFFPAPIFDLGSRIQFCEEHLASLQWILIGLVSFQSHLAVTVC